MKIYDPIVITVGVAAILILISTIIQRRPRN